MSCVLAIHTFLKFCSCGSCHILAGSRSSRSTNDRRRRSQRETGTRSRQNCKGIAQVEPWRSRIRSLHADVGQCCKFSGLDFQISLKLIVFYFVGISNGIFVPSSVGKEADDHTLMLTVMTICDMAPVTEEKSTAELSLTGPRFLCYGSSFCRFRHFYLVSCNLDVE